MSIFPTKILLATDGSKDAELAADAAIELANKTGSELHVLYVGDFAPSPHADTSGKLEQIIESISHRSRSLLGERIGLIAAAGGDVSGDHVRVGRPAHEIVALAEEIWAGLIVVGSRGLSGIRRALMGSVSDSVVKYAHCPVMVVRGGEEGEPVFSSKRILLATDGSEEAILAARTAVDLAEKTDSELHVVHVAYLLPMSSELSYVASRVYEKAHEEAKREAQKLLDEQVRMIQEGGGTVADAHLRTGRPDEEVIRLSEELEVGLVAVGSRGLSSIKRVLMGSLSNSVVRNAHCAVLVIRREEGAEQDMILS